MLVLVQHLIRKGRYDRARVTELGRLLARYEAQPGRLLSDPAARAMAERIAHLKRRLAEAFGEVRACASCARGCAAPQGVFEGGRCCGTSTLEVFTQAEVRALKLAGVAPPEAPAEDGHERAGCIFRGATSCSLGPDARPSKCAVYVCHDLRIELDDADEARRDRIASLRRELAETFARFEAMTR